MNKLFVLSLAVVVAVPALAAQRDSVRQRTDTGDAEQLRAQIEQRFTERVRDELKLSADQTAKLRASQEKFGTRRRALMRQQMERRRALEDQMQPGVAANADSVNRLMEGIRTGQAEMLRIGQEEDRELSGYLTPVQRARFQRMRERFLTRVGEMRREGRGMGRGEGRGMGGRPRPRRRGI